MTDVLTPEQRRRCMASIKGKDTKPEMALRKALWAKGLRHRVKSKLPGKPDIVYPSQKIAVFVDGCFWHGCPRHCVRPATNAEFWDSKINKNVIRDIEVNEILKMMGWIVIRIWEHEIKTDLAGCVNKVCQAVNYLKLPAQ